MTYKFLLARWCISFYLLFTSILNAIFWYNLQWLWAEWQKALYSIGGSEVKKWGLQLRRSVPDGMPSSSNGTSLQQQEMSIMQERNLTSSPNPYSKASAYMKGGLGQPSSRKQILGGHSAVDNSRGLLQWVQSITFVSISVDHSLQLMLQADSSSPGSFLISFYLQPSPFSVWSPSLNKLNHLFVGIYALPFRIELDALITYMLSRVSLKTIILCIVPNSAHVFRDTERF